MPSELTVPLMLFVAVLMDQLLGEPQRFHPLAGFGSLTRQIEKELYRGNHLSGVLAVSALLIPFAMIACVLQRLAFLGPLFSIVVLYLAIAPRSLREHAWRVSDAADLSDARKAVGMMVSRDTGELDESGVARAAVESVLENGNDAIFAALFWFLVGGAAGVLLYRLANTLDAMWGYRDERYNKFGWAAAKLDDVLNYIPARLTALSYALLGNSGCAWRCWREQAKNWESPNAGPVMAAGGGALQVMLGGGAHYQGRFEQRPHLGCGKPAERGDIARAVRLVQSALYLWLFAACMGALLVRGAYHGA